MDQGRLGIDGPGGRRTNASPIFGRCFFLPRDAAGAAPSRGTTSFSPPVRIASSPSDRSPALLFSLKMSDKIKTPTAATVHAKKKLSIKIPHRSKLAVRRRQRNDGGAFNI
jgi:hypothetical protein